MAIKTLLAGKGGSKPYQQGRLGVFGWRGLAVLTG
jgi:hypothetical protein